MALVIREALKAYDYFLEDLRDPRVDDWFLMKSVWAVLGILAVYLYFVLDLGPRWMEHRKPFVLRKVLIVYNAVQIIYCSILLVTATIYLIPYYNVWCEPCDYSNSFRGLLAAKLAWWYFFSKIIDLLDTIFFVLRKKSNQITFLHVFHHAAMVLVIWIGVKFVPGGHSIYLGYINSFVHICMYSYYLLSIWDNSYANNISFKKQITHLQMIQFALVTICYGQILFRKNCDFPKILCAMLIPQNLFMFYLFADFYYKTYKRNNCKTADKK